MAKRERQPIERDSAAEMVDMMKANIGSEPAQDDRKIVMRTAVKGSLMYVPSLSASPKRVLELVLNIEQPDPERSADQRDRQMHEQEWTYTHDPDRNSCYQQNGEVRRHRAQPGLPTAAHQSDRQAVLQEKEVSGPETKHHQRMAVHAVSQPAPTRQQQIFADRQRVDIAHTPPIEIARVCVVGGMGAPPEIIGCQREYADRASEPVVHQPMTKERTVAAIVLDHE